MIRYFNGSFDCFNFGEGVEVGAESSMHADDLIIDDSADRHGVEDIEEVLPDLEVVPAFAWVGKELHSS